MLKHTQKGHIQFTDVIFIFERNVTTFILVLLAGYSILTFIQSIAL